MYFWPPRDGAPSKTQFHDFLSTCSLPFYRFILLDYYIILFLHILVHFFVGVAKDEKARNTGGLRVGS